MYGETMRYGIGATCGSRNQFYIQLPALAKNDQRVEGSIRHAVSEAPCVLQCRAATKALVVEDGLFHSADIGYGEVGYRVGKNRNRVGVSCLAP